jgi:SAM-dependent methyltransferase
LATVDKKENALPEYDLLADLYNLEYAHDYDVPFWLSLADREGGPVIEWGAGTGRVSVPMVGRGSRVTAVELSEEMIERGRSKNGNVEWVSGDMCRVKLDKVYELAVCAFNSFLCLLDLEDALDFLANAREHLVPGGLLGIEVSVFSPEELAEPSVSQLRHDFTRKLPDGKLDRFSASRYDPATQIMDMRLFYDLYDLSGSLKNRRAHELKIRLTTRDELELMLRMSGFSVESVYGGFDGEPFTSESEHLIVLARRS